MDIQVHHQIRFELVGKNTQYEPPRTKKKQKQKKTSKTKQWTTLSIHINRQESYLPTPPHGQDMTQGQFLSGD